jgi:glycerate 2-kinase
MKIVIAPNAFKESAGPAVACRAIAAGVGRVYPQAEIVLKPIADGGDGTAEALVEATGGKWVACRVDDPLGRPIDAAFGMLGDGRTAVVEMATASGLKLLLPAERNPLHTTTRGTGQLIRAAIEAGAKRIIVGMGGSATVDGGVGAAEVFGYEFLDSKGKRLADGGGSLIDLVRIKNADPPVSMKDIVFKAASDVENPLLGKTGAARVYGPQKGATPEMVEQLEAGLSRLAARIKDDLGCDVAEMIGAGAAGGLGAGLIAFFGAKIIPGADLVLEAVGLAEALAGADLVITGEGRLDSSTAYGKGPAAVGRLARAAGVPAIALAGSIEPGTDNLAECGIEAAFSIVDGPMTLEQAMADTERLLADAAENACRIFKAGRTIGE